jgi:hypothetical protein
MCLYFEIFYFVYDDSSYNLLKFLLFFVIESEIEIGFSSFRVYMDKVVNFYCFGVIEMVEAMKNVAKLNVELSVEERNLLSVGYKNVVGAHRASWRILSSIEHKEESKGHDVNVKRIKEYRHKVETELSNICSDIMAIIDDHLIPSSSNSESSVFFYKMKGDYYRYLAEFKSGDERKEAADHSMEAYQVSLNSNFFIYLWFKDLMYI